MNQVKGYYIYVKNNTQSFNDKIDHVFNSFLQKVAIPLLFGKCLLEMPFLDLSISRYGNEIVM